MFIPLLHWKWNDDILDSPWCLSACPSIHLSVRPSVCPSLSLSVRPSHPDGVSFHFHVPSINFSLLVKKIIWYQVFNFMGWVAWSLFIFLCSWHQFGPLVAKYLAEKGASRFCFKNFIHFIPTSYPYGVSLLTLFIFLFLLSISAPWWPNIWPKIGLP